MVAVPAQSFSAPARARLMAAARVMPGVCGVLASSCPALTMRTPCCFQSGVFWLSAIEFTPLLLLDDGKGAHWKRANPLHLHSTASGSVRDVQHSFAGITPVQQLLRHLRHLCPGRFHADARLEFAPRNQACQSR